MLQCYSVTVLQCYSVTVLQCHSGGGGGGGDGDDGDGGGEITLDCSVLTLSFMPRRVMRERREPTD